MSMKIVERLLLLVTCSVLLCKVAYSQDACERLTISDLGSSNMLSTRGLLSDVLSPQRQGGENVVAVRVLNINIVCEAQQMMRNRYRYTSVVVSYNCLSGDIRVPECSNSSVVFTEQFDLGCIGGQWSPTILTISNQARTQNPIANLTTGRDTDCILCINPDHPAAPSTVDVVTHCVECTNCTMGLQRCFTDDDSNEVCCNFFSEGVCVTECPSPLVPNTDFVCGCTELSEPNGLFQYTNGQSIGSVATLSCNSGFSPFGTNPVVCEAGGWTGMPTCEQITIGFNPSTTSVLESDGSVQLCARLLNGNESILEREVVVTFMTNDGDTMTAGTPSSSDPATAPDDYTSVQTELTFTRDNLERCVDIPIIADSITEGPETFTGRLVNSRSISYLNLLPDAVVVTIMDVSMVLVVFAQPVYDFTETEMDASVSVVRSGNTDQPLFVEVEIVPSIQTDIEMSAPNGIFQNISFAGGVDSPNVIQVPITLMDDSVALEAVETLTGSISIIGNPDNVELGTPSSITINVLDDDVAAVRFGRSSVTVMEGADSVFMMCVTIDRRALQDVTVTLQAQDGSAISPDDYIASSIPSSVTIMSGSDRACFEGSIVDNSTPEGPESFTLRITGTTPAEVTGVGGTTRIDIIDNDNATVRFERDRYTFAENAGTGEVCLIKDAETPNQVLVTVTTSEGSATDSVDYVGGPFSVTFEPSANDRQCIQITIISDTIRESSESFTADIVIAPDSGVSAGVPSSTTITITDSSTGGTQVNDTAIGDPLMTVPLFVPPEDLAILDIDSISLCYEIHGRAGRYFNLITDECTSVNAYYIELTPSLNVIGQVGVRARDNNNQCQNILVDVNGCVITVGGITINDTYMSGGISVRRYVNRVRISVPNCNEQSLVMWIFCETRTIAATPGTGVITGQMIKFVVMRGLNFGHSNAHGLIGQFWNVPARISNFTGVDINNVPQPDRFVINIPGSNGESRSFTGFYLPYTWEFTREPCLYVGNRQGGPILEVAEPNDSVIDGTYSEYQVQSAFSEEEYDFGRFDETGCAP